MDISGDEPIQLDQNNCPLWQFPSYFSAIFWVPSFRGHFKALNNMFWKLWCPNGLFGMHLATFEIFKSRIDLSNELSSTQIRDCMQKL